MNVSYVNGSGENECEWENLIQPSFSPDWVKIWRGKSHPAILSSKEWKNQIAIRLKDAGWHRQAGEEENKEAIERYTEVAELLRTNGDGARDAWHQKGVGKSAG